MTLKQSQSHANQSRASSERESVSVTTQSTGHRVSDDQTNAQTGPRKKVSISVNSSLVITDVYTQFLRKHSV